MVQLSAERTPIADAVAYLKGSDGKMIPAKEIIAQMAEVFGSKYGLKTYQLRSITLLPATSLPHVPDEFKQPEDPLQGILKHHGIEGYLCPVAEIAYPLNWLENYCDFYIRIRNGEGITIGWSCSTTG